MSCEVIFLSFGAQAITTVTAFVLKYTPVYIVALALLALNLTEYPQIDVPKNLIFFTFFISVSGASSEEKI